jgi:hypothetical protein
MRKTNVERWQEKAKRKAGIIELNSIEDLLKLMADDRPPEQREVNPTQLAYILSDERYKGYMGPAGCAKTTTGVLDIIFRALMMPGTKWFIARKNYNDLLDTTVRTATDVLSRLPNGTLIDRSKNPPMKWWLKPMTQIGDGAAEAEPSEITFMGLTDNVGSYEFNGGFIDEADEVEEHYFQQLKGRLRHKPWPGYPDKNYHIGLAFNPPATSHWLYKQCTGMDENGEQVAEPTIHLFRPKPRENIRNLPQGYYESMASTLPADLLQRLVEGVWGSTFPGEPVIKQFRRETHVRKGLTYKGGTLYRFLDFGYNHPACLWAQVKKSGGMEILAEYKGSKVEGSAFADLLIRKTSEMFPNATRFLDFGDPAVAQTKDTGQMLAILNRAGILVRYQKTPFDISMNLLRKRFEMLDEGQPSVLIDDSCRLLIDGLAGGYHYKDDGVTPMKGLYDHLIDALRYGVYNLFGTTITTTHGLPSSVAYWSKTAS